MPQFVVLTHDHPFLHWDLMLEKGDALATWRLSEEPVEEPCLTDTKRDTQKAIPAEQLDDHRIAFLDYEGAISQNRGEVTQWDRGEFEVQEWSATRIGITLSGKKLQGEYLLEQNTNTGWLLIPINPPQAKQQKNKN